MKKNLAIALLLLLLRPAFSQLPPSILLNQITEDNGLSDNHVQCVFKDSQGFVWIGTADGFNLLDGSVIQVFRHKESDSTSLGNNDILSITEDASKSIWIATTTGLSCYEKRTKKFHNVGLPFSSYGASNIVRTVIAEKKNRLWCATDGGLFLYNLQTKTSTPFYNTTGGESLTSVNKLINAFLDSNGALWLCTFDGLWMFDTNALHFKRAVSKLNDADYEGLTTSVFEDDEHRLWFGNWSHGLKLLDREKGTVTSFVKMSGAINHITGIGEMKLPGGRRVICLNSSLTCFDAAAKQFMQLPKPSGLATYPEVKSFYQSADGWLWMCSDKGVWTYNPQRQFFQHHFFSQAITSQSVSLLDWNGELLVGGEGKNFLTAYDDEYRIKNDFRSLQRVTSFNNPKAATTASLCLAKESESSLLISNSNGLLRYNNQNGKTQWLAEQPQSSTFLPTNFIQHVFIDSKKRYWIFPWRSGVYEMDSSTGNCHLVYKGFLPQGAVTKGLVIADAAEDEAGNIWMADLDEGIVLFDRNSQKFSKPFERLIGGRSRSARVIYRNGFCYSFADNRLLKWDTKKRLLQIINPPLQMQSDIYDIVLDKAGYCWLATKKGLLLYFENTNSFKQFTTADGLLNNDMDGNLYLRETGKIIFATPASLTQFNPQDLLQSTVEPASNLLTGIDVNGETIAYDGSQTLRLNYTQNNLLFHWTVIDYTAPFHNQYWCRLQDIDADWKYVGNRGELQYANLSPGTYTLLLKGSTANGAAADKIITIHFK